MSGTALIAGSVARSLTVAASMRRPPRSSEKSLNLRAQRCRLGGDLPSGTVTVQASIPRCPLASPWKGGGVWFSVHGRSRRRSPVHGIARIRSRSQASIRTLSSALHGALCMLGSKVWALHSQRRLALRLRARWLPRPRSRPDWTFLPSKSGSDFRLRDVRLRLHPPRIRVFQSLVAADCLVTRGPRRLASSWVPAAVGSSGSWPTTCA